MKTIKKIEEQSNQIFAQNEERGFEHLTQTELEETVKSLTELHRELEVHVSKTKLSVKSQIHCLKVVKPTIVGRRIFFHKIMVFERTYLASSNECHKVFYNSILHEIREYIASNRKLFIYYSLKHTDMDSTYFALNHHCSDLYSNHLSVDCYSVFHTTFSRKFANFICCELLNEYVSWRLNELQSNDSSKDELSAFTLQWTGAKTSIVELGYALYASASINGGTATIKEIIDILSETFEIDLGDYYRIYTDIKSRKKNQVMFLESLKTSLLKKIEADEE